jgi:O-antigen/teichoic acid export membrane protein
MDKYGFRAKMYVVAALFNLVLTMLLTSRFGSIGAASSTAIAIVLSSGLVLNWYYDQRVGMDMRHFWLSIFREIVPIALLCAAAFFMWDMWVGRVGWLELVLGIAVYTVLFCVVTYLLSLNEDERALVKGFLQRA